MAGISCEIPFYGIYGELTKKQALTVLQEILK